MYNKGKRISIDGCLSIEVKNHLPYKYASCFVYSIKKNYIYQTKIRLYSPIQTDFLEPHALLPINYFSLTIKP